MESSEILPEWKVDIPLSNTKTIRGKLLITCVRSIKINNISVPLLERNFVDGEILKFHVTEKSVDLIIEWWDYLQLHNSKSFEHVTIQADNIEWENIPHS